MEKIKIVYVKVEVRRSGFILWLASRAGKKNQINSRLRLAIQASKMRPAARSVLPVVSDPTRIMVFVQYIVIKTRIKIIQHPVILASK